MKTIRFTLVAIVGCVLMLSVDAQAIRIPTKAIKKIFTEKTPKEHWHYNYGTNEPRYHYNKEDAVQSTGDNWYPANGTSRAYILNRNRIDSLYKDSLRNNVENTDIVNFKIDSIQKNFNNTYFDSNQQRKKDSSLSKNRMDDLYKSNKIDSIPQKEKNMFDTFSENKWLIIFGCTILLLLGGIFIYPLSKKNKESK